VLGEVDRGDRLGGLMIEQWADEAVPVLVTTELQRESIAIIAPGAIEGEIAEITETELERLATARFVIVDLTRSEELGRSGRSLLKRVHAWLPVGAELAVVASAPAVLEALRASALGRSLPCYAELEDGLAAARLIRAESAGFRRVDSGRPGLRMVDREACYSADWL